MSKMEDENLVPKGLNNYIKFGHYEDVKAIISSGLFLPVFITGLARGGKTCMPEQICHELGRELIRVNFTEQTDEEDMIGGFRINDGNMNFFRGPVPTAMERGAILLLDEIDQASYKCMCLQPILEGASLYLKKTRQVVHPLDGFNIVATANTKGQGDIRGKFGGAQIMNEAFLDRFSVTFEHEYPPPDVERIILRSFIKEITNFDEIFITALVAWSSQIRSSYNDNIALDLISTGRLIHIIRTYVVFRDPFKAVRLGIARFNEDMKDTFYEMFKKSYPLDEEDFRTGGRSVKSFMKRAVEDMDLEDLNVKRTR